ncbi:unnamed protein product [Brassica rapa subsp. trilocularis]
MRNIKFKEFRQQYRHNGSLVLIGSGSNKVMQVVLVILLLMKSVMPSLEPQGCLLYGDAGLLIADMPNEEVEKYCRLAFPDTTSGTHFYFGNECLTGQSFLAAPVDPTTQAPQTSAPKKFLMPKKTHCI